MKLKVVAGQRKERVGAIEPQEGMLTSQGRILKVNQSSLTFEDGSRLKKLNEVTVRHTEAVRHGYPNTKGCKRVRTRQIRRGGVTIDA